MMGGDSPGLVVQGSIKKQDDLPSEEWMEKVEGVEGGEGVRTVTGL